MQNILAIIFGFLLGRFLAVLLIFALLPKGLLLVAYAIFPFQTVGALVLAGSMYDSLTHTLMHYIITVLALVVFIAIEVAVLVAIRMFIWVKSKTLSLVPLSIIFAGQAYFFASSLDATYLFQAYDENPAQSFRSLLTPWGEFSDIYLLIVSVSYHFIVFVSLMNKFDEGVDEKLMSYWLFALCIIPTSIITLISLVFWPVLIFNFVLILLAR